MSEPKRFKFNRCFIWLPLTGLAAAPQSSARAAFAAAHLTELHFSPIVRGSQRKKRGENLSFPLSALPKIADFISRFEFSFLRFLAFSVPFSNHTLRDFKEEISNNLLRFCILFRFRELHFLRDR